jgi:hypothetical protein
MIRAPARVYPGFTTLSSLNSLDADERFKVARIQRIKGLRPRV